MGFYLVQSESFCRVENKKLGNQIFGIIGDRNIVIKGILALPDFFIRFLHIRCLKRRPTIQQSIKNNPSGPNINLIRMPLSFQNLRRNIIRSPTYRLPLLIGTLNACSKPKISNFHLHIFRHQQIAEFQTIAITPITYSRWMTLHPCRQQSPSISWEMKYWAQYSVSLFLFFRISFRVLLLHNYRRMQTFSLSQKTWSKPTTRRFFRVLWIFISVIS